MIENIYSPLWFLYHMDPQINHVFDVEKYEMEF